VSQTDQLRRMIKSWLPRWAKTLFRATLGSWTVACGLISDSYRYLRYSRTLTPRSKRERYRALLTATYHTLEKALSLPTPRPGFGRDTAESLAKELQCYIAIYGDDDLTATVTAVLQEYCDFNASHGVALPHIVRTFFTTSASDSSTHLGHKPGGVLEVSRSAVQRAAAAPFDVFVRARYSVRDFAPSPVEVDRIRQAVVLATRTPSVCNRQAWRVHCYQGTDACARLLKYQNGNRGFTQAVGTLLIVTCDLSAFAGGAERNEPFVDGGMFAMSLVYALHSMGLGTCCLNLCQSPNAARLLRRKANIRAEETFIVMIAVGELPDAFRVTYSARRTLTQVLTLHGSHPAAQDLSATSLSALDEFVARRPAPIPSHATS
jgi:nitroreductase